jgi:hypothetical protein
VWHSISQLPYRKFFEFLLEIGASNCSSEFPVFTGIVKRLENHAREMINGAPEYLAGKLGIWWPIDEQILVDLVLEDQLGTFYSEARDALVCLCKESERLISKLALDDALNLNKLALKLPKAGANIDVCLHTNVYHIYRGILEGREVELLEQPHKYRILQGAANWSSIDEWLQKVIWYQNKTGGYLYKIEQLL